MTTETTRNERTLFHKVGTTLYEISVRQSENAHESAEDILLRLITEDSCTEAEEVCNG